MTPTKLLLSGRLCADVASVLERELPDVQVRATQHPTHADLDWADAYSGFTWPANVECLSFEWVHSMGAGVDAFIPHRGQIGTLTRTLGGMPGRMGQFVAAVVLGSTHHLVEYALVQQERQWAPRPAEPFPLRAVVLGCGSIASGIADTLGRLGTEVIGINRSGDPAPGFARTVAWKNRESVLGGCPLVVAVLPGSDSTAGIVDDSVLQGLESAVLLNVGRGSTLNLPALRSALDDGSLAHAHLDVFEHEPLEPNSWLWAHPRVSITPHVGALTTAAEAANAIVVTYEDIRAGRTPELLVGERG